MDLKDFAKKWGSQRANQLLVLIFIFALIIRLQASFANGLWWDEGRYAQFGIEVLKHPFSYETVIEGGGPITKYEPLLPYMLGLSQMIFGIGEFAVKIVNPLLGALTVIAIFYLAYMLFDKKKIGLIAAALLSVSPVLFFNNSRILLETPEVFFVTLSIATFLYGYKRNKKYILYASGAFTAFAYLSRISGILVLPILLLYLIATERLKWVKNKHIWITFAIFLLVLSPWMIRNLGVCGEPLCELGKGVKTIAQGTVVVQPGEGFQFELLGWLRSLPAILTYPVFLFFVFGLLLAVHKRKENWLLLIWFAVVMAVMTQIWGGGSQLRRILILVPPLIVFASVGIYKISTASDVLKLEKTYKLILILAIIIPLFYMSFEQASALHQNGVSGFQKLRDAGLYLRDTPADTKILANSPNQISFYSGGKFVTADFPDTQAELPEVLKREGYDYIIVDAYEQANPNKWIFSMVEETYITREHVIAENNQALAIIYRVNKEFL